MILFTRLQVGCVLLQRVFQCIRYDSSVHMLSCINCNLIQYKGGGTVHGSGFSVVITPGLNSFTYQILCDFGQYNLTNP